MLKKHWKSDWFLASLVSLAFLPASGSNASQSLERKAYNGAASTAHLGAGDRIAIITIDNQSLANIVRQLWPRDVQASMLNKLSAAKPKIIGHAAFFLERQICPVFAYINQITDIVAQSKTHSSVLAFSESLTVAVNQILEKNVENRYQTGSETALALKYCVLKTVKV